MKKKAWIECVLGTALASSVLNVALAGSVLNVALASSALAQDYPNRVVRLVAPFSPGGSTDVLTRLTGAQLSHRWNQSVVVENRVGASGRIGAEHVAKNVAPDGYTLLVAGAPHAIGVSLFRKVNYDLEKDLVAIANIATFPSVIVVHPSMPVKSARELIALAKKRPGEIARIEAAAHFVPLEQLCLAPQCGFASTEEGNVLTEDEQWAKLERIVETAQRVWG